MRTAYCPKSHVKLAFESACSSSCGHVPGHQYHDVHCVISRRGDTYRCHIVESWGSCQGYDEEHGRKEAIGRGDTISDAARSASERATQAGMDQGLLAQAVSKAEDAAEDAVEDAVEDAE